MAIENGKCDQIIIDESETSCCDFKNGLEISCEMKRLPFLEGS